MQATLRFLTAALILSLSLVLAGCPSGNTDSSLPGTVDATNTAVDPDNPSNEPGD